MNKHKVGEGMELDLDTNILYVDGMKPFKVEPLTDAEQEGLEDWHKILEGGKEE